MSSLKARISKLVAAVAALADAGRPKLTYEPMLLGGSPGHATAVADGTVKDRGVAWPDEAIPSNPIW
jgi:hypothetical protein